jgi:RNA polymerase sigma-70 factor (ECF subfamily)
VEGLHQQPANEALLRRVIEEDAVVRAYVRAVTRGHRETEDVIQEVWKVVCLKIGDYDDQRPFRAWVLGITRLQLLKWRQEQARSREILMPDLTEVLSETAEQHRTELDLRRQYLRECLAGVPAKGRHVLELKYFGELKIAAVASRLRKSVAAVEMSLVRLRRLLRACIEQKLSAGGGAAA